MTAPEMPAELRARVDALLAFLRAETWALEDSAGAAAAIDALLARLTAAERQVVDWNRIANEESARGDDLAAQLTAAEADADHWKTLLAEERHVIEFRDDGWTIAHPLSERLDLEVLFDCRIQWFQEDPGVRGRFYLDADLSIAEAVALLERPQ